ncbi:hypothetical protein ABPG75_013452 [Micractinium tetrahymenae]
MPSRRRRARGTAGSGGAAAAVGSSPPAGLADVPPDLLSHIAQLGFISQLSPLYDRGDLLQQASMLACVGNSSCTLLAKELFKALSSRLGQPLPNGVTQKSTAAALKAALREWGLPVSGNKAELHQRLLDEARVQDSETDEQGRPLQHCLVSAATRRQLAGVAQARVSKSKAKSLFRLCQYQVEQLPSSLEYPAPGSRGLPVVTYLLADVKQLALRAHGSWQAIEEEKRKSKEDWDQIVREGKENTARREADVRAELARRGRDTADIDAMLGCSGMDSILWGTRENAPLSEAVDWVERVHWAISGEWQADFLAAFADDEWQPPRGAAQYVAKELRILRATDAALEARVEAADSLEDLEGDASIPSSLLPELLEQWTASVDADAAKWGEAEGGDYGSDS